MYVIRLCGTEENLDKYFVETMGLANGHPKTGSAGRVDENKINDEFHRLSSLNVEN